ncbi:flagellar protein FliT [Thiocystis violacea]|uniref:flagellar protein FliT n=1 Tax=Thiocystis violacea TaxID=13725 RepID=UPI001905492E|nr:flagellar protein FliT [Thiocystis violacea]
MPNRAECIADLIAATDQMKQAALGDDWELVERLQKRRRVLVERILEQVGKLDLTGEDAERLREVRRQEAIIAALAGARRQALSEAIAQTQTGVRVEKSRRMRRAYGDTDRRR